MDIPHPSKLVSNFIYCYVHKMSFYYSQHGFTIWCFLKN